MKQKKQEGMSHNVTYPLAVYQMLLASNRQS